MHEFSFFLLEHWLPVGIASIIFFLVGLLTAKFIWGRYSQRLSFAVDENLNLASQWSALGASQRDLFKKLRSRWQDDRDAWEMRLAETEESILERDARITQLTNQLQSDGKSVPVELEVDQGLRQEVAALRAELETREAELKELQAELELRKEIPLVPDVMPLGLGGTMEGLANEEVVPAAPDAELSLRVKDLEQDLIDTHDELHDVRTGYRKQVELVETLEARLIDQETSQAQEKEKQIASLEAKLREEESKAKRAAQLMSLASLRSREISAFRSQVAEVKQENCSLSANLEEALKLAKFEEEVVSLRELLEDRESELSEVRESLVQTELEVERLSETVAEKESAMVALEGELEKAQEMDRRRVLLQSELNDAYHEMYDVRRALHERLDEIRLLEARVDELDLVEEEKVRLESELHDTRHELSDLRMAFNEKSAELEQRRAQMEELEAIIEDRGAEVTDLSSELRQKRDQLRLLKESLAEKEGELEALSFESDTFTKKLSAKEIFLNDQSRRIADLELALTERYQELNQVRSRYDEEAKSARYHAARADQVESELERRKEEFEASDLKIATTEQALDEANLKLQSLTDQLNESEATIGQLEEQLRTVSREKDDTLRELDRANRRVEELESATSEREQRIIQFEADWKEALSQSEQLNKQLDALREELEAAEQRSGSLQSENSELNRQIEAGTDRGEMLSRRVVELEQRIEQLQTEVEEAQVHRDDARESISKLEASLSSSDERVMDLSRQIEEKDQELSDWKSQVDTLAEEHSQHQEKLREAEQIASSAKAEYEERLATASLDEKTLQEKQGGLVSQHSKELERLKKTLAEKEAIAKSLSQQREKGMAEIERLRLKVSKRGQSIRDLQNEVSSIMMQRANRDDEIAMLKNKLRAVESELEDARKATKAVSNMAVAESPSLKSFEKTLQLTLSEEMAKGPGKPLDQIEAEEEQALAANHEVPKPKKVLNLQAPTLAERDEATERKEPEPNAAPVAPVEEPQESEPTSENQKSSSPEILFGEQSAELTGEAKQAIDEMARKIRKGASRLAVSIIGFAGAEGSPDYSERLSAQRADAVRERLLARGVAQSMLTVRGAGQDRRFTDARARRVELILESKAVAEAVN